MYLLIWNLTNHVLMCVHVYRRRHRHCQQEPRVSEVLLLTMTMVPSTLFCFCSFVSHHPCHVVYAGVVLFGMRQTGDFSYKGFNLLKFALRYEDVPRVSTYSTRPGSRGSFSTFVLSPWSFFDVYRWFDFEFCFRLFKRVWSSVVYRDFHRQSIFNLLSILFVPILNANKVHSCAGITVANTVIYR